MIDERDLFERAAERFDPPVDMLERLVGERARRQRNRRLASAVVALVIAVLAAVALAKAFRNVQHPVPAVRPPTGTIVFSRAVDPSDTQLYTIGPDGVLRLLTPKGFDVFSISPDGSQVLYPDDDFDRTPEILPAIVDLDGSHGRILRSRVPMFPGAWSPDGSRIVGLGFPAVHSAGLYTASAIDGGDQIQVTSTSGRRNDNAIGYSPDGSKILFLRSANDVGGNNGRATKDLFAVNVDGSSLLQLNPPGTVLGPFDSGVAGTPPSPVSGERIASWSPDGTRVAFAAALATPGEARRGEVPRGLFVVDADGTGVHRIVTGQILDAQWSPDGRWIAFTQANPDRPDVFIVRPDGTGLRGITSSSSSGLASWGPVWSPASAALLFTRNPGSEQFASELWFANIDGPDLTQLTNARAYYFSYGWSPIPKST